MGVTSSICVILKPTAFNARTADSRPGPGPLTRTSRFLTPYSLAAVPARSAATCAANGVLLREPLKPQLPAVAHDSVLPWRSVMLTIVLLNDACTCATASRICRLTFFLVVLAGCAMLLPQAFSLPDERLLSDTTSWPDDAGPYGYARSYGYAGRASAGRGDDGCPGSNRGPSNA